MVCFMNDVNWIAQERDHGKVFRADIDTGYIGEMAPWRMPITVLSSW